jgi:hypothetical protein
VNRVKLGFFSVSDRGESDDDIDDRAYLAWHQLDHMPEQYQLPGMIHGQRWVSNDACRAARAAASGVFEHVHHVVLYLMGDPVEQTIDDFFDLGSRLAHLGRFPRDLPRRFLGGAAAPGGARIATCTRRCRGRALPTQPRHLPDSRATGRSRPPRLPSRCTRPSGW